MREGLSFDDVLIVPDHHSEIKSRKDPSVMTNLGKLLLDVPIIGSPMDTVSSPYVLKELARLGTLGIMHRYCSLQTQLTVIKYVKDCLWSQDFDPLVGFSIGVNGVEDTAVLETLLSEANLVCIDVANGDSAEVISTIKELAHNDIHIMAGNVATKDGFKRLMDAGADSIRCGVGSGAYCSTRTMTGIGVPQITAIEDCASISNRTASLIADGGIRSPGDLCKALAAGADVVMLGSVLVGTDESPGKIEVLDGKKYKLGRGMASTEAQRDRGTSGKIVPEGVEGLTKYRGSLKDVIHQFEGGLRSSMTYVNADNLNEYKRNTEFIKITNAGLIESNPHDIVVL